MNQMRSAFGVASLSMISSHGRLIGVPQRSLPIAAQTEAAGFQAAQRFLQRFLEGPADGHGLADRFHLRGQRRIGFGKLLEGQARHLGDDVIDGRLEAGRRLRG